ncbi:MAG: ABC transporter ATP-binding protein [Bacteroidetes bacterium]|nr:MAG: ABC transporter ATP-binding protein [Bacteroidota bacterium]
MIEIKNLEFAYKKKAKLFDDLNLELSLGNIYGLLGKNGAGKTTLLKLMTGLLFPQSGECLVLEERASKRDAKILSEIFIVPEEFDLPAITVNSYLNLTAPFYPRFNKAQFYEYMNDFEISENDNIKNLSFGQKKKFLLAFGISTNTKLLILDEPSNALDIPSKSQFRKIIASSINEDRSVIISSHQVRDLSSLLDNIIIVDNGKIIFNHNVEDISKKLVFKKAKDAEINNELYSEEILGVKYAIQKNKNNSETNIDLEMLFNAVINNPEKINNEF